MGTKITFAGVTTTETNSGRIRRPAYLKMLRSGLINCRCANHTTDDYAWDDANDYGRTPADGAKLADEIADDPSGWWAFIKDGELTVVCHNFLSYKAVEGTQEQIPTQSERLAKIKAAQIKSGYAHDDSKDSIAPVAPVKSHKITAHADTVDVNGRTYERELGRTLDMQASVVADLELPGCTGNYAHQALHGEILQALIDYTPEPAPEPAPEPTPAPVQAAAARARVTQSLLALELAEATVAAAEARAELAQARVDATKARIEALNAELATRDDSDVH